MLPLLLATGLCCCLGDNLRESVIVIQDGGVPDDYMGVALLAKASDRVVLLGDVLVDGDSLLPWSFQISSKLHSAAGIDAPLGLSSARGANPFPYSYRGEVQQMANITALRNVTSSVHLNAAQLYPDADVWLEGQLMSADPGSITIVCTSGLTSLSAVLARNTSLQTKIKRLVWAAGAVRVAGNLDRNIFSGFNNCAEWNVFWDGRAAEFIFNTTIRVDLLPLDISNQADPFRHPAFLQTLQRSSTMLGRIAYESYKLVMVPESRTFLRLWDLVAAGLVSRPDLFDAPEVMRLEVGTQLGDGTRLGSYGCLRETATGREVRVYRRFDGGSDSGPKRFLDYVAQTLSN